MAHLNHKKAFPTNAEWSYLYAVADVYESYSAPHFDKENPSNPHPLTDSEVVDILEKYYNLKNIHRNTVANIRKKLETYFDMKFGVCKKGKYIKNSHNSLENEDNLIMIGLVIKNSSLISAERTNKIMDYLYSVATSRDVKQSIQTISKESVKKSDCDCFDICVKLSKAIVSNNKITIDHPRFLKPQKIRPIEIVIDNNGGLKLVYETDDKKWHEKLDIRHIRSLTVLKRGMPKK